MFDEVELRNTAARDREVADFRCAAMDGWELAPTTDRLLR
jgi:hypothetical protein